MTAPKPVLPSEDYSRYAFADKIDYLTEIPVGLSEETVRAISAIKSEPEWMLNFRLRAYKHFVKRPMPDWGGDLGRIDFNNITYYKSATKGVANKWEDVPDAIKQTFEKLGIPEAERKFLAGAGTQYDSEVVYHKTRKDLEEKGVIFCGTDSALKEYPEIFKKHFGTVVPPEDNKFAALNSAVWSGGSFVYVPAGVNVEQPLQAYFRINAERVGQFERTLIIAEPGAKVNYVEGCVPVGEEILVGDSTVPVETITEGQTVLNSDGQETTVAKTMVRPFDGDLIDIVPVSVGNAFQLTPEHPVLVVPRAKVLNGRRKGRKLSDISSRKLMAAHPEFIPAGELTEGDLLVYPVNKVQRDGETFTEPLLKILGYYLAEGSAHLTNGCETVTWTFHIDETAYVADLERALVRWTGKHPWKTPHPMKHAITVGIYSDELSALCREHCGKYAAQKRLSKAVMDLPPDKQRLLVEAYWRGDGNEHSSPARKGTMIRSGTASKILAFQLQELYARQGTYATINVRPAFDERMKKDGRVIHHATHYTVYYQDRKRASAVKLHQGAFLVPIRRIGRTPYTGNVHNFHVSSEPNTYLVKGFAVHNCTAPVYSTESLHSAVVEVIAKKGATIRYTTLQNWSKDVYNLVTKRAHAHENAVVEWLDANTGCLAGGTRITLNSDLRPISQVMPGDTVFALNRDFELERHKVIARKWTGAKPVFRLVTDIHREIVGTANHPFLCFRKVGRQNLIAWRRLDELRPGDHVAVSGAIPDCGVPYALPTVKAPKARNHVRIPGTSTEDLLWFLGFYAGDGYSEKARVCIAVPPSDPAHLKVVRLTKDLFGLDHVLYKNLVIRIASRELVILLRKLGCGGRAQEKRIPPWVYTLPQSQRKAYIDGLIAADGHIRKGHRNISLTSCNRLLLEDVKQLAITCGLNPLKISRWSRVERKPLGKEEKEYVHYALYFADWTIDAPIGFARVDRIVEAGIQDTWDLEVEGAHNFVANGFVVHNSRLTMKYPSVYLLGKGARAEILSVAFAGGRQHQDAGAKVVHLAPNTTSRITSKSVSKGGGRTTYRGLLKVVKGATNVRSSVRCDALMMDDQSRSDTYPYNEIEQEDAAVSHEASVGKISDDMLFYLQSRGIKENDAMNLIVLGFVEIFTKELPMEYALEFNRLVQLEMQGSVG